MGVAPPPRPRPGAKRRRRGGCCACCLFLVLAPLVVALVLLLVSWAGPRLRKDPVEKEWKAIPDYFGARAPGEARRPGA